MSTEASMHGIPYANDLEAGTGSEESVLDRNSAFDGVLRSSRNLRVEGQAKGEVYCDGTLYIAEEGRVDARVVSANITVAGALNGEITCHGRLHLLPSGRVSGRVATAALAIQEGAIYEGEIRMSNLDEEPATIETPASPNTTEQDERSDEE